MSIVGIGIDLVEIPRFQHSLDRFGDRLLTRLLTPAEIEHGKGWSRLPTPHFAGRFAAKEAVSKALGTGIGARLEWHDIEIRALPSGAAAIELTGRGLLTARELRVARLHLSISHTECYAVAQVIAEADTPAP